MAFFDGLQDIGQRLTTAGREIQASSDPRFLRSGSDLPSDVKSFQFFQNLTPEQKERFLELKRGGRVVNLGGEQVILDPSGRVTKTLPVTPGPALQPGVISAAETAKGRAVVSVERQKNLSKAQSALKGFEQQTDLVTKNIDKALDTISPFSTGFGSFLSIIPDTDARKLSGLLDTIKANVGFDKLQNMRDNSPTGGALGQVSELENRLLQATSGALDPGQSELLEENLIIIKDLYPKVLEEKKRAFDFDFGGVEPIKVEAKPKATPTKKTRRVFNPVSGEFE